MLDPGDRGSDRAEIYTNEVIGDLGDY